MLWSRQHDYYSQTLLTKLIRKAGEQRQRPALAPAGKGDQPGIEPGIPATASAKRGQRVTKHKLLDTIHMVPNEQAGEWLASGLRAAGERLAMATAGTKNRDTKNRAQIRTDRTKDCEIAVLWTQHRYLRLPDSAYARSIRPSTRPPGSTVRIGHTTTTTHRTDTRPRGRPCCMASLPAANEPNGLG